MSEGNGLPKGWLEATLSTSCEKIQDGTHFSPPQESQKPSGTFPYVTAKNVRPWGMDLDSLTYLEESEHRPIYERCDTRKGDVLLVKDGVNAGDACVNTIEGEVSLLSSVCMIRPHGDLLDARFLRYYLLSPQAYRSLTGQMTGTAIKRIILAKVRATESPIAPLSEQHRIVEKIDELFSDLDAGVASLERAKGNLKRYRSSVLKSAVEGRLTEEWRKEHPQVEDGQMLLDRILRERREKWEKDQIQKFKEKGKEPPKNWESKYEEPSAPDTSELPELPEGWVWATVDQLLVYLRNGYFQSPTKATTGIPLLRINAVRPMSVDLDEVRYLDEVEGDVDDFYVHNGDLLFTRYNGSVDLLGVAGMVRGCTRDTLHPDKLIRVVLGLGSPLPEFVEISANVGASRKHISGRARTTAGQTGISGSDIREMPIPLPPLAEQEQIVALVEERLSQIDSAEKTIDSELIRSKRLRQSILKRAFEGKLVPQDPKDEPASVLLERIKASRESEQPKKKAKKARAT
jgi:type I restriction enzyme, S subunit